MANSIISSVLLGRVAAPVIASVGRLLSGKPPIGGIPVKTPASNVNVTSAAGATPATDTRVRILVPEDYIPEFGYTEGGEKKELKVNQGIVFPYTPQISYEQKADYAPLNPMHSNHPIYFYQRSSVTPISIQGKFTVQNEEDAAVYLSTVHLLKSLTKMRTSTEDGGGSPPPVCRLYAYGVFGLDNVPVAISSVRIELPESVDYFSTGRQISTFDITSVPTLSTISVTCIPMYSRTEMQNYTVTGWLNDSSLRKAGLL